MLIHLKLYGATTILMEYVLARFRNFNNICNAQLSIMEKSLSLLHLDIIVLSYFKVMLKVHYIKSHFIIFCNFECVTITNILITLQYPTALGMYRSICALSRVPVTMNQYISNLGINILKYQY